MVKYITSLQRKLESRDSVAPPLGSANQITEELRSHDNHTQASSTQYNGDEEDIGEAIASAAEKLGYSELRKNQELVVRHFLRERDVFVSLPTGSGKSLWHFANVFFLWCLISFATMLGPSVLL